MLEIYHIFNLRSFAVNSMTSLFKLYFCYVTVKLRAATIINTRTSGAFKCTYIYYTFTLTKRKEKNN